MKKPSPRCAFFAKTEPLQPPQQTWLGRLANLNAARTAARGIAPHQPLMLLTVIDFVSPEASLTAG
jgi:hypothetical protein